MRLSELFGSTLRKAPADAEADSYRWLARGGYIRAAAGGDFDYLPLGALVRNKLGARFRYELESRGGQEFVSSAQMNILRFAGAEIQSYRQLPKIIFSFDEITQSAHPRLGLFGAAHSPSLRICFLTRNIETQKNYAEMLRKLLDGFFEKLQLPVWRTKSGGYTFLDARGGGDFIRCPQCNYLARQDQAQQAKIALSEAEPLPLEKVATPNAHTIESLAAFLEIPKEKTAKAVFMTATIAGAERLVFAILRGDMDLCEAKLLRVLKASALRPATDAEIRAVGAVPGYASPIGIENVLTAVDELIPESTNLVAGANEDGCHFRNVNYGRDFSADVVADLAATRAGSRCPNCSAALAQVSGSELVAVTPSYAAEEALFTDEAGKKQPLWFSEWRIDFGRIFAAAAEKHHDDYGLILPPEIAPYDIHLVWLPSKKEDTRSAADDLYLNLIQVGFSVLYDDREMRAGAKFNDADLIGCPVRITIGERTLAEGAVEIKLRAEKEKVLVETGDVVNYVLEKL